MSQSDEPIWKRPGWITAMVGVISAFITIPQHVAEYLSRMQTIKENQQKLELMIVKDTLAQQGDERVFLIRYLAATVEDADAKAWAINELALITKLRKSEFVQRKHDRVLEKATQALKNLIEGNDASPEEIASAKLDLEFMKANSYTANLKLEELKTELGIINR